MPAVAICWHGPSAKICGLTQKQNCRIRTRRFDAKWNTENTEPISRYFEIPTTNTEPTWKKYRLVYRKTDTDLKYRHRLIETKTLFRIISISNDCLCGLINLCLCEIRRRIPYHHYCIDRLFLIFWGDNVSRKVFFSVRYFDCVNWYVYDSGFVLHVCHLVTLIFFLFSCFIPFSLTVCLSGLEFMAQHLIGLNLTCQIVSSVLNAHMIYPNLIRATMVYPKALYSDLCFSHCTPLLSVLLFPHSHSVTISGVAS